MERFNVCVVRSKDVECDCRLDLISSAEGDFVMHEEVRKMVQSHHLDLATYAKSLDAAQAEAEAAKRCLHVEMSMRKASEVEPPKSVGPWHVVPGHDGAFVPVTKDGRSWWNGYFQASIAIDVATLLNEREAHNAEIAKLSAEVASLQTEDGKRVAALRHAAGMVLAYADAEDRMADECRARSLGENAVLTRCRVRNILKRLADRIATDQPVQSIGGYDRDALGDSV